MREYCRLTMSFAVLPSCHSMLTSLTPEFLLSVILRFVVIDGGIEEHSIAASVEVTHVAGIFCALGRHHALGRSLSSARMARSRQMELLICRNVRFPSNICGKNLVNARNDVLKY